MGDDPADVARRVAASSVRQPLLVALCDWAVCAGLEIRRAWVLEVARRVDPEPWRDRAAIPRPGPTAPRRRDGPDRAGVGAVPPFLVALGERLHDLGGDGTDFLRGCIGAPGRLLGRLDPGPRVVPNAPTAPRRTPRTGGRSSSDGTWPPSTTTSASSHAQ